MEAIKTGVKLFIITLCAAALLGAVSSITRPVIAENDRKTREEAMSQVLPGFRGHTFSEEILTGNASGVTSYYTVYIGGETAGYVAFALREGDQGMLTVAVGINASGVVLGVKVIDHSETPGLGANAAGEGFLSQFTGKTGLFNVIKSGRAGALDIVAVTAATHSSRAVTGAVNDAVTFVNTIRSERGALR